MDDELRLEIEDLELITYALNSYTVADDEEEAQRMELYHKLDAFVEANREEE